MTTDQSREAFKFELTEGLLLNALATAATLDTITSFETYVNRFRPIVHAGWQAARQAEREVVAKWMIEHSFATGHGDTLEDLLKELSWQVKELRDKAPAAKEQP